MIEGLEEASVFPPCDLPGPRRAVRLHAWDGRPRCRDQLLPRSVGDNIRDAAPPQSTACSTVALPTRSRAPAPSWLRKAATRVSRWYASGFRSGPVGHRLLFDASRRTMRLQTRWSLRSAWRWVDTVNSFAPARLFARSHGLRLARDAFKRESGSRSAGSSAPSKRRPRAAHSSLPPSAFPGQGSGDSNALLKKRRRRLFPIYQDNSPGPRIRIAAGDRMNWTVSPLYLRGAGRGLFARTESSC